ncbi:hypothetical protein A2973_02495 [Candidatus Gottesmanbacteria bacterium RIFCSPLOWO2_01_FULL_49_10]|uniref:Transcriptional repressor n=1 Tax=Candidatus Gottesmanbacteria bacterium RIFCSPLOWO2_01_FULL_49_10 TaxID=1798396 RepID=A0A1F6AZH1_9BACT|nr:MAG: hypothetical protein A2973_02495 [Candidatus Gottesmanbacteria bacterium RIFCSPLOWO2_01_FULL_49_10]
MPVRAAQFPFLHETGHRLTTPRRRILDVLPATPTSAQELFGMLRRKGVKSDLVTVYRTLDLFTRLGLVQKTQFGDQTARYELVGATGHHHHLVCEQCGSIEDVPLDEQMLLGQVGKKSKFQVTRHTLEFFGRCIKCQ